MPITTPGPAQEARVDTPNEQAIARGANREQDAKVQKLFDQYREPLSQVFNFYSPDRDTLDLSSFIQMGMDFDLYPTFVDKAELRNCFQEAQLKFSSQSDTVGYSGFVDALYLLAVASLSKKAFSNLYPTDSEKVNVLLGLWGLGDPLKLEQVKGKHRGL